MSNSTVFSVGVFPGFTNIIPWPTPFQKSLLPKKNILALIRLEVTLHFKLLILAPFVILT